MKFEKEMIMFLRRKEQNKNGEWTLIPFGAVALGRLNGNIHIAGSVCHPRDQFRYDTARLKTLGRLRSDNPKNIYKRILDKKSKEFNISIILMELGLYGATARYDIIPWSELDAIYRKNQKEMLRV